MPDDFEIPKVYRKVLMDIKASDFANLELVIVNRQEQLHPKCVAGGLSQFWARLNFVPASTTRYTDTSVDAGHTYFYVVTSVDSHSVESSQKKDVAATVPPS